jgi:phosphoenolpyruvate---glycerone phosphotransferase subunit DhaL
MSPMADTGTDPLSAEQKRRLAARVANTVIAHADELTALDAAIGDGDHGHNMKRGFEAVLGEVDALSGLPSPEFLRAIGHKLLTRVGGASGPLYATLFMTMGKLMPPSPARSEFVAALNGAVEAVKARGKSNVGQKTMIDVLAPALAEIAAGGAPGAVADVARGAAEATVPMLATRGRASFLGERSVGHMDPGARSMALIIAAVCDEFGGL